MIYFIMFLWVLGALLTLKLRGVFNKDPTYDDILNFITTLVMWIPLSIVYLSTKHEIFDETWTY